MEGWTASSPHCLLAVMLFCGAAAGTQCPDGPLDIQAVQGSNATVEWCFSSNISTSSLKVLCLMDPELKVFYHLDDKFRMIKEPPHQQFAGRVHCDKDALRTGRLRLHLSRVQMDDSGQYRCGMSTKFGRKVKVFSLNITAAVDEPKPPTPQPEPESRESLWLYVGLGLAAVAAAAALVAIFYCLYIQKPKLHQEPPTLQELQEVQTLQDVQELQKPKVNNMAPLLKQDSSCEAPQVIKLPVGAEGGAL